MRMHRMIIPCAAALLMASGGAALAQSSSATPDAAAGTGPLDLTCAQLATMDTEAVPGVLYYLSGYGQARHDTDTATTEPSSIPDAAGVSKGPTEASQNAEIGDSVKLPDNVLMDEAEDSDVAENAGAMDNANPADADAANPAAADVAENAGALDEATPVDAANPDLSAARETSAANKAADVGHASKTADAAGSDQFAAISSHFITIPVEDVVSRCQQDPESTVSDILANTDVMSRGIGADEPDSRTSNQ